MSDPHQGWFRVEEEALRHLKRTFDEPSSYRKASAAYIALLRISNLKQSTVFDERIGAIADDMGYSYNDAAKALQLVKLAGLCEIEARTIPGSKERDKSVYTVKRMLPEKEGTLHENGARLPESRNSQLLQRVPKKSPISPEEGSKKRKERMNEPILSNGSSSFNESEAIGIRIPKTLRAEPAFMESWDSHCQDVLEAKPRTEAVTMLKRQLGLCLKWHKESGIEKVCEILDGAIKCGSTYLLDEDHEADPNDIRF